MGGNCRLCSLLTNVIKNYYPTQSFQTVQHNLYHASLNANFNRESTYCIMDYIVTCGQVVI